MTALSSAANLWQPPADCILPRRWGRTMPRWPCEWTLPPTVLHSQPGAAASPNTGPRTQGDSRRAPGPTCLFLVPSPRDVPSELPEPVASQPEGRAGGLGALSPGGSTLCWNRGARNCLCSSLEVEVLENKLVNKRAQRQTLFEFPSPEACERPPHGSSGLILSTVFVFSVQL